MRIITYIALLAAAGNAQTLTTIFGTYDGRFQPNTLIQGADGNLYGTTFQGGLSTSASLDGNGTIFKVTPSGTMTTLYSFGTSFDDGALPNSLVQGSDGNLYGTTSYNAFQDSGISVLAEGYGTVFKLTPSGTLTTLYWFCTKGEPCADGSLPGNLIQGADGNFYGTTSGTNSIGGTFFKITPRGTLTTLYNFGLGQRTSGSNPEGSIVEGTDGNFYGTTSAGGILSCGTAGLGCGTIYQLTPQGVLTVLYSFGKTSTNGTVPTYGLVQATDGNFYGTTSSEGANGAGTVFQFTPSGMLNTLDSFTSGCSPTGDLLQAADGNLYGINGCGSANDGSFFEVTLAGALTTAYNFCALPNCTDGSGPNWIANGTDGNLYGITKGGGTWGGIVYKFSITLPDTPAISTTGGVLNGASFQSGISPGSWITIGGTNLSSKTDTWDGLIVNGALPTILDGVSVMVGGEPAYIEYVSSTQINAVAPNVPAGTVPVTVSTTIGTSQAAMAQLAAETPAFFQWGTYAVATHQDFTYAVKNGAIAGLTTVPAKPGDVIILWGTGFGPTSPAVPSGVETPSTATYNTATPVSVTIGGKNANVYGAALAPGYAGLYQIAILIPASLSNGDYPVIATIDGVGSPSTTMITVQQ
jgi:uncharacterized protein (TIGR03437 family)